MRVVFRTDSSAAIGSGHAMRCLTLADVLYAGGAQVSFICRRLPGNIIPYIREKGYPVHGFDRFDSELAADPARNEYERWLAVESHCDASETESVLLSAEQNADWLIVDHYALDAAWQRVMRPYVARIMVIDDLADREHDCDLLLDQNLVADSRSRYDGLVPATCRRLLGPHYAPLREEFRQARQHLRQRGEEVTRLLVFFGGADATNETAKAIAAIKSLNRNDLAVDIVVGGSNPHRREIEQLCDGVPFLHYHRQVRNMAEIISRADLALGAAGTTTWERACLGLPTLLVAVAANQIAIGEGCDQAGIGVYLGFHDQVSVDHMTSHLQELIGQARQRREISKKAIAAVDGEGVVRVTAVIEQLCAQGSPK